ncbi:hypothetical protein ACTJK4_16925 [Ralstonia sp. 22111]|uniref:hypothetical protein n=1 Tax=Ralstonia sp. 22111 TaxID=3453878 RepID=UPI003F866515
MSVIERGQLAGEFTGFSDQGTVFEFFGGGRWRQARYFYHYHYAFMPRARVEREGGRHMLYVDGVGQAIEVVREY